MALRWLRPNSFHSVLSRVRWTRGQEQRVSFLKSLAERTMTLAIHIKGRYLLGRVRVGLLLASQCFAFTGGHRIANVAPCGQAPWPVKTGQCLLLGPTEPDALRQQMPITLGAVNLVLQLLSMRLATSNKGITTGRNKTLLVVRCLTSSLLLIRHLFY